MQKTLIAILLFALLAVSGAWGYSTWKAQQPAAAAAAPVAPAAKPAAPAQVAQVAPSDADKTASATPAPAAEAPAAGGVKFTYEYVAPKNPDLKDAYDFAVDIDILHRLPEVNAMDGMLMLPGPLHLIAAECGQINAFYSPAKHELVMCYEMVDMLVKVGAGLGEQNQDQNFSARFLLANARFIMLHEFGHALIDMLKLPSTGREEDAADQLASSLMLMFMAPNESPGILAENLRLAGLFFMLNTKEQYGAADFADEHSLGQQRFYNLMCMLYGHDPAKYLRLVTSGMLPEDRALRCQTESNRITTAWAQLLLPHIAPKYRMSGEEAQRTYDEAKRKQEENTTSPYVR
ncbi:MAG: DUF4344 domain-containing metallopeptidase [Xanthomonas sp.]